MHVLDKQLSSSLCFNFMHYVEKKNLDFSTALGDIGDYKRTL